MSNEIELRKEISSMMNRLYLRGLVSSVGGNVSLICREEGYVLITPAGLDKGSIQPEDIVKITIDGEVIDKGIPSSETIVHLGIYNARKDIKGIVHAHPPIAVGMISSGYTPRGVTPEFVVMIGELAVVDFTKPGRETSKVISEALKSHNIVVLKNHGVFSVGTNLMQAFSRVEVLEEASKMLMAGKLFGGMPQFSKDQETSIINNYVKKID
ncbi:class II aldolase/adducin family protein [Caldisericum sp.]|jgi:L-fuculose-phosphate aldolase|uniref:class II aldolase/adducin family protein n=1 Tax=Caldisericum sp. TaxID=2499687 RepID=UPI003D1490F7